MDSKLKTGQDSEEDANPFSLRFISHRKISLFEIDCFFFG